MNAPLGFEGESCSDGKHSKKHITLLVGTNRDGLEKPVFVFFFANDTETIHSISQ